MYSLRAREMHNSVQVPTEDLRTRSARDCAPEFGDVWQIFWKKPNNINIKPIIGPLLSQSQMPPGRQVALSTAPDSALELIEGSAKAVNAFHSTAPICSNHRSR